MAARFFKGRGDQIAKKAILAYTKGMDETEVIRQLEKALVLGVSIYPLDEIYKYIGAAYFDLSLHEQAQQAYEAALEVNPGNHTVLSNLGLIHEDHGNTAEALECYRKSLESKPDNAFVIHNIGTVTYKAGEYDKALKHFHKALALNPNLSTSHAMSARTYAHMGKFQEAQDAFLKAGKCGYDSMGPLREELKAIKEELPRIFFEQDAFLDLGRLLLPNRDNLAPRLLQCLADPEQYYRAHFQGQDTEFLTPFIIHNALHWHVLGQALTAEGLAVACGDDDSPPETFQSLLDCLRARDGVTLDLENFAVAELLETPPLDIFGETDLDYSAPNMGGSLPDLDSLLESLARDLLVNHGYHLLHIWLHSQDMLLCPVRAEGWERLGYPFQGPQLGYGVVRPLVSGARAGGPLQ